MQKCQEQHVAKAFSKEAVLNPSLASREVSETQRFQSFCERGCAEPELKTYVKISSGGFQYITMAKPNDTNSALIKCNWPYEINVPLYFIIHSSMILTMAGLVENASKIGWHVEKIHGVLNLFMIRQPQ